MNHAEFMTLFDQRRKGISTLIRIYNEPGKAETYYTSNDTIRHNRVMDLEKYGLVEIDRTPRKHNVKYVRCTDTGKNVAESFLDAMKQAQSEDNDWMVGE